MIYSYKKDCIAHEWSHNEEKSYQCNTCEKTYSQNSSLKSHMGKYPRVILYQCSLCDKDFKEKKYILKHHRKKNGENPNQYSQCQSYHLSETKVEVKSGGMYNETNYNYYVNEPKFEVKEEQIDGL
ncbi:unnamed protein product, partial [Meganyctiphanes norvegica]